MEQNISLSSNFLVSSVSLETLLDQIESRFTRAIEKRQKADLQEKLCPPNETCKILNVSKVTLNKWDKEGRIKSLRIGSRVYYKYSEIMSSLQTLKRYQRVA
jgi:hypothetical protein